MKTTFRFAKAKYILAGFITILALSCEKDEERAILNNGFNRTKPNISKPAKASVIEVTPSDSASVLQFQWQKASYGVDVQVNYYLEIDSATNGFKNAQSLAIVQSDTFSMALFALNAMLLTKMKLPENVLSSLELRVFSTLSTNTDTMFSDVLAIQFKTYK